MEMRFLSLLVTLISTMFLMGCNIGNNNGQGSGNSNVRLVKCIEVNYERYKGYKVVRYFSYDSNDRVTKVVYTNYYDNKPYAQITTEMSYPTSSSVYMKYSVFLYEENDVIESSLAIELNANGYVDQLTWLDDGSPYTTYYEYDSSGHLKSAECMISQIGWDNDFYFIDESLELSWRNGNIVSLQVSSEEEEVSTTRITYNTDLMSNINLDLNYFVVDEDSLIGELSAWGPTYSFVLPACGYLGKINTNFIESMYDYCEDEYEYSWKFDSNGCPISCTEKFGNYQNEFKFTYYN